MTHSTLPGAPRLDCESGRADPGWTRSDDPLRTLYDQFFDRAEVKRRWNLRTDIPWGQLRPGAVHEEHAAILEAFYATEMFLPDYTARLMELNRRDQGLAWFLSNWSYEESKHSLALEEWLVRSGHRTREQMAEYNARLLARRWELPFETSRQMLVYTVLQERATQLNYLRLARACHDAKDPALHRILKLIAGDEGVHHGHFIACVRHHLDRDRSGTVADIEHVLRNFRMPISDEIPGWQRHQVLVAKHEIYSNRSFVQDVMHPSLKRLAVTRAELRQVRRG